MRKGSNPTTPTSAGIRPIYEGQPASPTRLVNDRTGVLQFCPNRTEPNRKILENQSIMTKLSRLMHIFFISIFLCIILKFPLDNNSHNVNLIKYFITSNTFDFFLLIATCTFKDFLIQSHISRFCIAIFTFKKYISMQQLHFSYRFLNPNYFFQFEF
jgi:hypothetical protein